MERNFRSVALGLLYLMVGICHGHQFRLISKPTMMALGHNVSSYLFCEDYTYIKANDGSPVDIELSSITNIAIFKKAALEGEEPTIMISVNSDSSGETKELNGRTVKSLFDVNLGKAEVSVELIEKDGSEGEFTCQVIGKDTKGNVVVKTINFDPKSEPVEDVKPTEEPENYTLTADTSDTFYQMVSQLETRLETDIKIKLSYIEDKFQRFNEIAQIKMDSFERRIGDKISQIRIYFDSLLKIIENKVQGTDVKCDNADQITLQIRMEFAIFYRDMQANIEKSLKTAEATFKEEERKALTTINDDVWKSLKAMYEELRYVQESYDLLTQSNQTYFGTVEMEIDNLNKSVSAGNTSATCVLEDKPVVKADVVCHRYMFFDQLVPLTHYVLTYDEVAEKAVVCDTRADGGGWIVIQRRVHGDVDFGRTWKEYKDGFGDINGDFWLGNEAVYKLTNQHPYELRIDMKDEKGRDLYAEYGIFKLDSEVAKYRLTLGSYRGNFGEGPTTSGFHRHNDVPFSTIDQKDYKEINCPEKYNYGWWFIQCYSVSLNGVMGSKEENGMWWETNQVFANKFQVTFSEMKIRKLSMYDSLLK
ncbi:hypothetical protein EGW08_004431 [Elysia chlorotica]|uniref:Fibrinogen C-terminal domain-containing protein n=1 Tax=Elysia chlorotica TaxID=188477 RepID=A0A433U1Y2_ELYCH|nr:hypothetical protein EGW08_004431 [Elysia chlorotica]